MKISILLVFFCSINIVGLAQVSLLGRVIDSRSKKAIADVSIKNEEMLEVSKSNALGYFQFKGDSGNHLSFQKQNYFESKYLITEQKNILIALERSRLDTPEYRLGNNLFYKFLGKNIKYPDQARRVGIEGKLLVSFDIDTLGKLTNIHMLKELTEEIHQEVVRVLNQMPYDWIPSHSSFNFVLPITFRFDSSPENFDTKIDLSNRNVLNELFITALSATSSSIALSDSPISALFKPIPKDVAFSIDQALQSNTKTKLVLKGQSLKSIPSEIGNIKQLTYLDMEGNKLNSLPDEISLLSNLQEIYVPSNRLSVLPLSFSNLNQLKILGLGKNRFEYIPEVVFELKSLEMLDLSENNIISISSDIGNLTELKVLILSNNKLESLPISLNRLRNLEELYIKGNKITNEEIKELKNSLTKTEIYY